MINGSLESYRNYFKTYTELRIQENRTENITFVDGNIVGNSESAKSGVSARVCKNGSWGFASNADFETDSVKTVIRSAGENAEFMDSRLKRGMKTFPTVPGNTAKSFATSKERTVQKGKFNFIKALDSYIIKNCNKISSRTLAMRNLDMEKNIITSDGGSAYSLIPRSIMYIILAIEKDGVPVEVLTPIGSRGQFEDIFQSPDDYFKQIDSTYRDLLNKSEGVYSNAGYKECILDSKLSGVLAHEAIGHTTEADLVLGGSIAAEYLEQEVASPLVTLIDFANEALGETCPIPIYTDDEGVKAEDTVIIEKGILKNFMHNKESADHFVTKPTGNARAYEFSDEPLIRMRNTAILPGKDKLDDMISSIKDGYYLIDFNNGQADSTSEFMFGITLGYEINNGKLGKAIKDTTISGVAFDMLKTISMISDDLSWSCSGMCGKKQPIPVGMGGPAVKCKVNIGGR